MAKHGCSSKYFADDKDLEDILSLGKFTEQRIRTYAASRGIFLSPKDSVDDMIEYLKIIPCGWEMLEELVRLLDTKERSHKLVPGKIPLPTNYDLVQLETQLDKIKTAYCKDPSQKMDVVKRADGSFKATITYYEINHASTRLIQKEPGESSIEIFPTKKHLGLRYQESPRAEAIVDELKSILVPEGEAPAKLETIDLKAIRDPKKRTQFFVELITKLYAHNFVDLTDLRVEYLESTDAEDLASDESSEEKEKRKKAQKEEIKSRVKSIVYSGEGLLRSKEYQELVNSKFFLCRVTWIAEQDSSAKQYRIKVSAELSDPQGGSGFTYRVHGGWNKNNDGDFKKTMHNLNALELSKINGHIEQSAFDAHETVSDAE